MKAKQLGMVVLWVLAVVLPGGFPLLGAWLALRTARARAVSSLAPARVSYLPSA